MSGAKKVAQFGLGLELRSVGLQRPVRGMSVRCCVPLAGLFGEPPSVEIVLLTNRPGRLQRRGTQSAHCFRSRPFTQPTEIGDQALAHIALHARRPSVRACAVDADEQLVDIELRSQIPKRLETVRSGADPRPSWRGQDQ